jgi:hypothetical protein
MEDVLFDSISSLATSIEEHRVSELLRDPKGAARSAAGAAALVQNAETLVGLVKAWNSEIQCGKAKVGDNHVTSEVVEVIFSSLHRWLSWKSLAARLPKSQLARSSSKTSFGVSKQHIDVEDSYLDGDPWQDSDDLAAEDLMMWLVEANGFREGSEIRADDKSSDSAVSKPVQQPSVLPDSAVLKPVKLTPRHSTETASTVAPSDSIPTTSRSIESDSSSSFGYRRVCKSSEDEAKKDVLDCGVRLVPVLSQDDRGMSSHSRPAAKAHSRISSAPHQDVGAKKCFPGLLNPILDVDVDLPKREHFLPPASTWPRREPKASTAACHCISCLLGIDCHSTKS